MKAINLFALLKTHFNLTFVFIFQVVNENFPVDSSYCDCVTVMAKCYRCQSNINIVSFSIYRLHIFGGGNIKELNFSIMATTCQEKIVHWRKC
jgi:hypothetical protein